LGAVTPMESWDQTPKVGSTWLPNKIMPSHPTAQQLLASAADTPKSHLVVPEVWRVQVEPPFVVWIIMPLFPTAQQLLESAAKTPQSHHRQFIPDVWRVQVEPPSMVWRIVPSHPTAQQLFASTADTP
ncbi:MAG: hypothetical protein L6427_06320, partial [Actinomycetia bacterium]|nr:hypothetical protein [Actinomycetes bacterium]